MIRLLYVSRSRLGAEDEQRELAAIIAVAAPRNLAARVTGALVHTGPNFAQVLEGPAEAVDAIMGDILVDPRHSAVSIVARTELLRRSFPNWGMVLVNAHPDTQHYTDLLLDRRTEASMADGVAGLVRCLAEGASARV